MNHLDHALAYAQQLGWYVFPIVPSKKMPMTSNGFHAASTDEQQIREWWTRTPNANIGIACGASNIVIIDLDGERALERWNLIVDSTGMDASKCAVAKSGTGHHIIFRQHPHERVFNTAARIGKGIDTRGFGGYFLVEPSVVIYQGEQSIERNVPDGYAGKYEWLVSPFDGYCEIPPQLLELLREKETPENKDYKPPKNASRILQKRYELVANAASGSRNDTLYRCTFFLSRMETERGEHLNLQDVRETMSYAARACGLSERETQLTIESAIRGKY